MARRRLFARGEVSSQRSGPGRPLGLEWWGTDLGRTRPPDHPLRTPAGSYGARFAVWDPPCEQRAGWVLPRALPTRYTHPVIPHPGTPRTRTPPCTTRLPAGTPVFRTRVGEPRGTRTQPVIGSLAGYLVYLRFTRPFDWVLWHLVHVLLSLVPVLLRMTLRLTSRNPQIDLQIDLQKPSHMPHYLVT